MKRRILLVVLLVLALVLVFAMTASAKKQEAPHFATHAVGTFDYIGDEYDPIDGVWYREGTEFVNVDGRIDLRVDIESIGDAIGPYDDGSDFSVKWDYQAKGSMKAGIHVVDPYGNHVNRQITAEIEKVTLARGYLGDFYFFECTYEGETYDGYLGLGGSDYHLHMPLLGQALGGWDNYPIVFSSGGDFSYDLNDPAVF